MCAGSKALIQTAGKKDELNGQGVRRFHGAAQCAVVDKNGLGVGVFDYHFTFLTDEIPTPR